MAATSGAKLIAQLLKKLGVTVVFGIVGIPIVEVGDALIEEGIKFVSFRNEQAASYAASAYGYLTGKPGVLLVVGGPGVIHALAGIFNSNSNRWPLLVLAGSSSFSDVNKGGFQEFDQVNFLSAHTKFAGKPLNYDQVSDFLFKAYKSTLFGKPGSAYLDLPADIVEGQLDQSRANSIVNDLSPIILQDIPKFRPESSQISKVTEVLKNAKSPLIIIGKGAAYADASTEITNLVRNHHFAFLPTPMGKGVVPDSSELNVSSARSQALKNADVILLLGARLNWILHFGEEPRFQKDVKIIQVDNYAEEIGNNAPNSVQYGLVGDISIVANELDESLGPYKAPAISETIAGIIQKNNESLVKKENTYGEQLSYNNVYKTIREYIKPFEKSTVLISEGANTMDIARISFPQNYSRQRLDAGTNATMGVGLGYAIAAKAADPSKIVIAIEGDSAFGFSGLELETAARSHLPIIVVVMNNSGIYHGVDPKIHNYEDHAHLPSTALSKNTRYDLLAKSLGADGFTAKNEQEVYFALTNAIENLRRDISTVINVIISPGTKKKIGFGWQNKKQSAKL